MQDSFYVTNVTYLWRCWDSLFHVLAQTRICPSAHDKSYLLHILTQSSLNYESVIIVFITLQKQKVIATHDDCYTYSTQNAICHSYTNPRHSAHTQTAIQVHQTWHTLFLRCNKEAVIVDYTAPQSKHIYIYKPGNVNRYTYMYICTHTHIYVHYQCMSQSFNRSALRLV